MVQSNLVSHENFVRISAKAFAAKYKSKSEIFNFLIVDCKAYLPKYE